jgi:hypothetical protein
MSTALAALGGSNNAVARYDDDVFNSLSIQGGFLPRVNLYSARSKIVQRELFTANHWGIVTGKDKLDDLGENFHAVPLAYRPMALDLREAKAVVYFDPNSPKFKECTEESLKKDSKCMSGIQFLLYVQGHGLATYYAASKSAKMLAPNIRKLTNQFVTFGSVTVESGQWIFRAPTIAVSNVQFDLPMDEVLAKRAEFINVGPMQVADKDPTSEEPAAPPGGTAERPR